MKYRHRLFYGWWIVAVGFVCLLLVGGLVFYAFGAFFTPLMDEFGWTRAQLSAVMTMYSLIGASAPIVGRLVDRYGARNIMAVGALVTGVAYTLLALTSSIWYFYSVYFIVAIGQMGILNIPILTVVSNWFVKRRGLAIGITVAGLGLGGTLMAPFATYLISVLGWRAAYIVSGVIICTALFPLVILVIRHRPDEKGLSPYGNNLLKTQEGVILNGVGWTLGQALKTLTFWLLIGSLTSAFIGPSSVIVHLIPSLIDRGISAQMAAVVLSCATGASILGRIIIGYMADRIPVKHVAMLFYFLQVVGLVIFLRLSSMAAVWTFAVVFGLAMGGLFALEPLLVAEYFGMSSFGVIYGGIWAFAGFGFAAGPFLTGYIYDITGGYNLAFTAFIGTALLAIALIFLVQTPESGQ